MPRKSKIERLPAETRNCIDQELIARGFSGYEEFAKWARDELGVQVSRSAAQRHGSDLEKSLQGIRNSRLYAAAINEELTDDDGSVPKALLGDLQAKLWQFSTGQDMTLNDFKILADIIAKVANADGRQNQFRMKYNELKQKVKSANAEVKKINLAAADKDKAEKVQRIMLGLTDNDAAT